MSRKIIEILFAGPEELRRKFYSAILVLGGGIKFPGIAEFLEGKLAKIISSPHYTGLRI